MGKTRKDTKATNIARRIWRIEGECEYCGVTKDKAQMHGAHIFGVGAFPRLKDDLRNGLCLCSVDHRRFTDGPTLFADWIKTTKYKKYLKPLMEKNKTYEKRFWDERIVELKDIERAINDGEMTLDEARSYDG